MHGKIGLEEHFAISTPRPCRPCRTVGRRWSLRGGVTAPKTYPAKHPLAHYFNRNFWLTTSGNFRTQTLIDAILEVGADRILFSTDWPFENVDHAAIWFDAASISDADRHKIGRTNALNLFNLSL
jgi:gamma-resorcylate decarboxylase